ncbi:MAG TPA: UDP-3-O-(3-hydroxymyristoyl)glucosamine N-acyltransferase [candidate division Zixibacteria bacterium]|nr:UDP-3-O-(3-hydroxymyristoyl)glucosamine N-acyltransferase [candidate division Zixibacteria bacterium]
MRASASKIAAACGGTLSGPDVELTGLAGLREAKPGDLSFLANLKYAEYLETTKASCVIIPNNATPRACTPSVHPERAPRACTPSGVEGESRGAAPSYIVSDNPYLAWAKAVTLFVQATAEKPAPGVHPSAFADPSSKIDPAASIGAQAVVESGAEIGPGTVVMPLAYVGKKARIGRDCLIYSHVSIREDCVLGDRVILHCGTVIGSDGFGYARDGARQFKIPQVGNVVIGDDVEIGANVTVDRGAAGPTVIGRGTKIDNLVQIAHNVRIGEDCVVVAQSGVAGSTKLGDRVILAAQAGVIGHIEIGDDSMVGAQSGVPKSLPPKSIVFGYPARHHMKAKRIEAVVDRLPEYAKRVQELEKKVAELEKGMGEKKNREN